MRPLKSQIQSYTNSLMRIKWNILILFFIFIFFGTFERSFGQEVSSKCSIRNGSDVNVYQLYTQLVTQQFQYLSESKKKRAKFSDVMDVMPKVSIFRNESEFVVPDLTESDILLEGFYKADLTKEEFILVPILGVGVDVDKYDVLYFCIEYTPEEKNRQITFLTMGPSYATKNSFLSLIKDSFSSEDKKVFKKKLVSLNINPLSSTANVIERILSVVPPVQKVFEKINSNFVQKAAGVIDFAWLLLKRFTLDMGVYEMVVRPKEVELKYQVRILGVDTGWLKGQKKTKIKELSQYSEILLDEHFDEKYEAQLVNSN